MDKGTGGGSLQEGTSYEHSSEDRDGSYLQN